MPGTRGKFTWSAAFFFDADIDDMSDAELGKFMRMKLPSNRRMSRKTRAHPYATPDRRMETLDEEPPSSGAEQYSLEEEFTR